MKEEKSEQGTWWSPYVLREIHGDMTNSTSQWETVATPKRMGLQRTWVLWEQRCGLPHQ